MRLITPRVIVLVLLLGALGSGCLGLDLSPSVGGVLQSVIVEGEALPETSVAVGGNAAMRVTGLIVGVLKCDSVTGEVREKNGNLRVTITVTTGRRGCNSRRPTTLSYAANILNIEPGLKGIVVEHRYEGFDSVAGVRLDTLVTIF